MEKNIYRFNNVFSKTELELLESVIMQRQARIHEELCREEAFVDIPSSIIDIVSKLANSISSVPLVARPYIVYVEYSNKYGNPNLPPHFDGDTNDLILDFQLSSTTSWDLGLDLKTYSLEDNCAIAFNANEKIHWRPIKHFKDGESIRMAFFRFYNPDKPSDYSHLQYSQNHEIFNEVREYRNSLFVNE